MSSPISAPPTARERAAEIVNTWRKRVRIGADAGGYDLRTDDLYAAILLALTAAEQRGEEQAREALAAALDWIGDPDCDDGAWHRWRSADPHERKDALQRAAAMIARFALKPEEHG